MTEYLTIEETAELCRVAKSTIETRIKKGLFVQGVHFFRRRGMKPLFKRAAVIAWIEEESKPVAKEKIDAIPMAKGYHLGQNSH